MDCRSCSERLRVEVALALGLSLTMCTLDTALPVKMERRTCSAEDYAPHRIGGDGLQIMQLRKIMRGGRCVLALSRGFIAQRFAVTCISKESCSGADITVNTAVLATMVEHWQSLIERNRMRLPPVTTDCRQQFELSG